MSPECFAHSSPHGHVLNVNFSVFHVTNFGMSSNASLIFQSRRIIPRIQTTSKVLGSLCYCGPHFAQHAHLCDQVCHRPC